MVIDVFLKYCNQISDIPKRQRILKYSNGYNYILANRYKPIASDSYSYFKVLKLDGSNHHIFVSDHGNIIQFQYLNEHGDKVTFFYYKNDNVVYPQMSPRVLYNITKNLYYNNLTRISRKNRYELFKKELSELLFKKSNGMNFMLLY